MLKNKIKLSDISVIVQGPIYVSYDNKFKKQITKNVLLSIRKILPGAEIILSTWDGSDTDGLDYDKVLINKDPGTVPYSIDGKIPYNVNRQIISTITGLKNASGKYSIKIRTDVSFVQNNFLKYFYKYQNYEEGYSFLENKVIVSNHTTVNPRRVEQLPFSVSDWFYFGLTNDLINIWDLPLCDEKKNSTWFLTNPKPSNHPLLYSLARYHAEQYVWFNFINKYVSINFEHCCDISNNNIEIAERILANNVIILHPKTIGIRSLKYHNIESNRKIYYRMYSEYEWKKLYNKYCHGKLILLFDFELFLCKLDYDGNWFYKIYRRMRLILNYLKKYFHNSKNITLLHEKNY